MTQPALALDIDAEERAAIAEYDGHVPRQQAEASAATAGPQINATLRQHQVEALAALRRSIGNGKRRTIIQAPTGSGKTLLACAVTAGAQAKGNRVVFVVPALSLIDQTVRAFAEEGITDVGVIQADHQMTDWSMPIQVASVQTLQRRPLPEAQVVVIDECHVWFKFVGTWMALPEWQNVPFIGLSATPWTKGLGKHYDDLIVAATTAELIEKGYLCPFKVFAPSHPDLSGVRTVAGDYHEGDLSTAMDQKVLVADVVTTWLERAEDRPTLVFGVDRAHAKHLQEQFEEAGISAAYQDAYTTALDREQIRRRFERGDVKVVCNVGTLTTGVDWDVRCIVMARPTKSEMLFTQIVGRGLRTADGKDHCLILDHSDNHLRLGFVTDIHHEELDAGTERKKPAERNERLPKECPKCAFLMPPATPVCPACGHERKRPPAAAHADGELVEMLSAGRAADKKGHHTIHEKQAWYSSLLGIAEERSYKRGWAARQYREKFGVWPNPLSDHAIEPLPVVRSWVRSRLIAYAKSRSR